MNRLLLLLAAFFSLTSLYCGDPKEAHCGPRWSEYTKYKECDIIRYNNNCWIAKADNLNICPESEHNYTNRVWVAYLGEDEW